MSIGNVMIAHSRGASPRRSARFPGHLLWPTKGMPFEHVHSYLGCDNASLACREFYLLAQEERLVSPIWQLDLSMG